MTDVTVIKSIIVVDFFALDFKSQHCTKRQIFESVFARIRNDKHLVYDGIQVYSIAHDETYTWDILLGSGRFFRFQIEYLRMCRGIQNSYDQLLVCLRQL